MKILAAVDSFKGSISSSEINGIIAKELEIKNLEVIQKPLADGGEGTIDALIDSCVAEKRLYGYWQSGRKNKKLLCSDE